MRYSFPKFSFLIGLALIALICVETYVPQFVHVVDEEKYVETFKTNVLENMCSGKDIPEVFTLIKKTVPQFNEYVAMIVCMSCVVLTLTFNLLPQRGFFMWTFVHLLTAVFIIVAFISGYYVYLTQSKECMFVKTILTGKFPEFNYEIILNNPYVAKVVAMIPQVVIDNTQKFSAIFFANVEKLGITAPIFVVVIAFYLINSQTAKVTKGQILFLVSMIVCVISGINYYAETKLIPYAIVFPIVSIILVWIAINLALRLGYLFVAPKFLVSILVIVNRAMFLLALFKVPFTFYIACGIFVFLFANVFVWTESGSYLTIIFLLNYGLRILYPLPADSLVILVFIVQLFIGGQKRVVKVIEVTEAKPKSD